MGLCRVLRQAALDQADRPYAARRLGGPAETGQAPQTPQQCQAESALHQQQAQLHVGQLASTRQAPLLLLPLLLLLLLMTEAVHPLTRSLR